MNAKVCLFPKKKIENVKKMGKSEVLKNYKQKLEEVKS